MNPVPLAMARSLGVTLMFMATLSAAACGDSSSSPTAPTPQPTFVSMFGGWTGTYTTNFNVPNVAGGSGSGGCNMSMNVTSQSGGQFSGTFQLSGSYTLFGAIYTCGSSGTISGTITSAGVVTDLGGATTIGPPPGNCTGGRTGAMAGTATATAFNANWSERWTCGTLIADFGRVVSLRKQ